MIRRIVLENYMSHANTVIEPAEGLTVLVGPNNCGKSAVVSALLTVCGENDGDFMVRHGAKVARVTVETAEGDTITWQRKRTPSYVINGKEVHRVGRGNLPDELQPLLKLPAIEFGEGTAKTRFIVHFGLQKEPIFLIDSESDVAKFFSSSAEAERLLGMQRLHKKKTSDARGELKAIDVDLTLAANQLATLAPLDELGPEVERVESVYADVVARERAAEELAGRIVRIESAAASVAAGRARVDATNELRAAPAMDDPAPLDRLIERFGKTLHGRQKASERKAIADTLISPPTLGDEAKLGQTVERLRAAAGSIEATKIRLGATDALLPPPDQEDPAPLTKVGLAIKRAQGEFTLAVAQVAVFDTLLAAPVFDDPSLLDRTVERVALATKRAADGERVVATANQNYGAVRNDIVAWVTQHPVCPVCGNETKCDDVLEAGDLHAH